MTPQVFYRKWRPQNLAEVAGQEAVTRTLRNALVQGRISHAYLFCGPRGTGKTSTARILAKAVNCLTSSSKGEPCNTCDMCQAITEGRALDVIEIDAASNTSVEDVRSLREKVNFAPNQASYKVYIIDEVHMLSNSASNALLKTLEEPPPHVIFILATTEVHKILPTIMSRCQRFDFKRISQKDIISRLSYVIEKEGINIEPEGLRLIARSATGSLRDAENLLEQLATYYGSEISLEQVRNLLGMTGDLRAKELIKHIVNNDVAAGITTINNVNNDGLDLKQFNREIVEYLRALLLIKTGSVETVDFTTEDIAELKDLASKASLEQTLRATKLFGQIDFSLDSTLPLELALVECTLPPEVKKEPAEVSQAKPPEVHQPAREAQPRVTSAKKEMPPKPVEVRQSVKEAPVTPQTKQTTVKPADTTPAPVVAKTNTIPLEANSEIERLKINWKLVLEQAPADTKRTPAVAILRSAGVKPVTIENNTVSLSFRHPFHKEQIEKLENRQVTEKIISNFLGRSCRVQCVLENNHLLKAALKMGAQIVDDTEEK